MARPTALPRSADPNRCITIMNGGGPSTLNHKLSNGTWNTLNYTLPTEEGYVFARLGVIRN